MKEVRVYGPPGVGKTTWLVRQIDNALVKYWPQDIMVSSFTKAAASELTSRQLSIPASCVGTLHSHCYRLLSTPKIAEVYAKEFSETYPHFGVKNVHNSSLDDGALPVGGEFGEAGGNGDELLGRYGLLRNKLVPRPLWPSSVQAFAQAWESWKDEAGYMDFTDLIEQAAERVPVYEGKKVGLIDEAQDLTPLQLRLVRQWGENMETFVLVGDDDQAIYSFAGASPEAFLTPELPPEHEIVLGQSYRVPQVVQAAAHKWISGVSRRKQKDYAPRDFAGEILEHSGNFKRPGVLLNDAEKYLEQGKTVMFLAPCSYQLQPLIGELRKRGLPFHNPYRKSRGDWNPLAPGRGTSTADRLIAYLKPEYWPIDWHPEQIRAWGEMMTASGIFRRGMKGRIKDMQWPDMKNPAPEDWEKYHNMVANLFEPDGYSQAQMLDVEWLLENATADYQRRLEFPVRVVAQCGVAALKDNPLITVGTIHSVKGGEADVTYLCPDISAEAYRAVGHAMAAGDASGRDDVIRQFYVGMTRCRETLIMARPATAFTAQNIRRMQ